MEENGFWKNGLSLQFENLWQVKSEESFVLISVPASCNSHLERRVQFLLRFSTVARASNYIYWQSPKKGTKSKQIPFLKYAIFSELCLRYKCITVQLLLSFYRACQTVI